MLPDHQTCYRAISAKDTRFDGRLFTGVKTTGIYCRPICPARLPKSNNVQFYVSAAAAHEAGFRPCLRCRPETAPDTPAWRGTSATIGRAFRLIEEGGLDDHSVAHLALRLGIGDRQLRRLFRKHVGASPIAVAQTRRILLAKQLLHQTQIPMVQIALAAGFGSVRRFNEVFQKLFNRPPTQLRRGLEADFAVHSGSEIRLQLPFRQPYDWDEVAQFLKNRLYENIETFEGDTYCRSFLIDGIEGIVRVRPGGISWLDVGVTCQNLAVLPKVISNVRAAFDLAADPSAIGAHLSLDSTLAPLIAQRPGLRVPSSWAGFEGVVRAILGQQITVKAAIALGNHLVKALGSPLSSGLGQNARITQVFPQPYDVAQADLSFMPMPKSRQLTLNLVAQLFVDRADILDGETEKTCDHLSTIPGIGPWTLDYIKLRVLRDPDALPASDVALIRAMSALSSVKSSSPHLTTCGEAWRPWRSYAAQYLWASL